MCEVTASTPSNGSSRNNRSGLGNKAAASASFFFMPCEYSRVSFFSSFSRPSRGSNSPMRSRISSRGSRYIRPMKVRYSRAVRLSNSARSSGMTPIRLFASSDSAGSSMFFPSTRISPLRRRQETGQHFDRGRFAGAVRPQEAVKGAALDLAVRCRPRRKSRRRTASTRGFRWPGSLAAPCRSSAYAGIVRVIITNCQPCVSLVAAP